MIEIVFQKSIVLIDRTLFDIQNVWGRTTVDTQKPIDSSPLSEIPRQDVKKNNY
jgi:hypothetical protein